MLFNSLKKAALAAALIFSAGVSADLLEVYTKVPKSACGEGCENGISSLTFSDAPVTAEVSYYSWCSSTYALGSLVACMKTYCPDDIDAGWKVASRYCSQYGLVEIIPLDTIEASLPSDLSELPAFSFDDVTFDPIDHAVLLTEDYYQANYLTIYWWDKEEVYHHAFGWALWILLGAFVLVGLMFRLYHWVRWRSVKSTDRSFQSEVVPPNGRLTRFNTLWKKYVGLPALFGNKHGAPAWFMFSIPTRIQFLYVALYVFLNTIFTFVGFHAFLDNQYWPGHKDTQYMRYLADRTGIMAFYNMPLLWLLAGRNDFVIWLTGTSFSTLNLFHRWVARIAVLQAVVHSVAYTWLENPGFKGWGRSWAERYWRTGVWATIIWCWIIGMSILPIRKWWYEIFLLFHILAAAASLVLLYYHVYIFDAEYDPYIHVCIAIWAFDRGLRYIRLSVFSYNAITDNNAEAIVTGGENGLVRLTVNVPFKFSPAAGSYFFLYQPMTLTPWENHPFTLASHEHVNGKTKLHFLIAVHSGATSRLRKKIKQNPTKLRILAEGPYGHREPIDRFEHVLIVAGGSGVTAVLPYLELLKNNAYTRTVSFIWSVKNNAYTTDVMQKELAASNADVTIHITEEEKPAAELVPAIGQTALEENKEKQMDQGSSAPGISVVVGRPDLQREVQAHAERLEGNERLAVLSCGPAGMMDDLRKAIVHTLGNGDDQVRGSAIEYFEELFSW